MSVRHLLPLVALSMLLPGARLPQRDAAPPNEPAQIELSADSIRIRYNGALIFDGRVVNPAAVRDARPVVARTTEGAIEQAVAFHANSGAGVLEITGKVTASEQAFACESDRAARALPVVRHSSGLSRSLLNQAVYDRKWDWVLSVDDQPRTRVRVVPEVESPGGRSFALSARGGEIVLRFRPRFYQKHRGLRFFEPWTYQVWPRPVTGWCSWFAFLDKVTQQDVMRTADVLAEMLVPYGYEYLQVDDGYQRGTGLPELWLQPNEKFPAGLDGLAAYVRSRGLTPGIWTNATFSQTGYASEHKEWFVRDAVGNVASGNWINHPIDASVPAALDAIVRPVYRRLRTMGWAYFKLDSLRHLRYEGYNTFREHFTRRGVDPTDAFRRYVAVVREEIGRDRFLLACWGVRPELVGLVDGCRLGTDGFSYAGLAQYNSFNNIVWRNDPDHIELSDREAWRSTLVTSLTGSLFMLTDRPERYRTPLVEPARRAAPVLVTMPGQLYDVDPSRSSQLWRVDGEVSGRDPKPFDAGLTPAVDLYLLEINRPFESWVVLGRTGARFDEIRFEDLGLDAKKDYLVFEFWRKKFLGIHTGSFAPGDIPAPANSQAFIIRERASVPQVVATSRHITGGGVDLVDVRWTGEALAGRSAVVAGDPYEVYLTEPAGFTLSRMICDGAATVTKIERANDLVKTGCLPKAGGEITWRAEFSHSTRQQALGTMHSAASTKH